MVLKMLVYARTRFVAFHQWEDAPNCYKYLANIHRHEFHVEVGVKVNLSDRQEEFHHLKMKLNAVIHSLYKDNNATPDSAPIKESCESIASRIACELRERFALWPVYVDVSEDGECGGRVEYN
jgi:6-pyruvoyl-tetrahydropterin synthase